jgi:hypothetical protein
MKTIAKLTAAASVIMAIAFIIACNKDDDGYGSSNNNSTHLDGTSKVVVNLTDKGSGTGLKSLNEHPVFDAVNIDIEQVLIFYGDTGTSGNWTELATNAGIYDLTDLENISVVLANGGSLPPGHIGQMRLIPGRQHC